MVAVSAGSVSTDPLWNGAGLAAAALLVVLLVGMARLSIEPRLLPKSQAAAYCGMSIPTFDRICPVNPVDLELRGFRYDRRELDRWIDGLHGAASSATNWVGAFDNDRNGSAHILSAIAIRQPGLSTPITARQANRSRPNSAHLLFSLSSQP